MAKYIIIFILSVCIAAVSQIILKKGANIKYDNKIKEYANRYVISGYLLLVISTVLTLYAYKGVALSTGVALETISYVLVPVLSFFVFKEKISRKQIFGILLIISGIVIYSVF